MEDARWALGAWWSLVAAAFTGLFIAAYDILTEEAYINPLALTLAVDVVGAILLLPYAVYHHEPIRNSVLQVPWTFLMVVGTCIGSQVAMCFSVGVLGGTEAGLLELSFPLWTGLFFFLRDRVLPSAREAIGGAIVMIGAAVLLVLVDARPATEALMEPMGAKIAAVVSGLLGGISLGMMIAGIQDLLQLFNSVDLTAALTVSKAVPFLLLPILIPVVGLFDDGVSFDSLFTPVFTTIEHFPLPFICAVVGTIAVIEVGNWGISSIGGTTASMLEATAPLFSAFFLAMFWARPAKLWTGVACGIMLFGVAIMCSGGEPEKDDESKPVETDPLVG